MVFSSFIFIFYFLPLVGLAYAFAPRVLKNSLLALASLLFYSWGEPKFAAIFLGVCYLNYWAGRVIERSELGSSRRWRLAAGAVAGNVSLLLYYKYTNFFLGELDRMAGVLGAPPLVWERVILPIGISFTTFQSIAYVVDVYRRKCPAEKNLLDYLLYAFFFPHLIAGPIVRYAEIKDDIKQRVTRLDDVYEGLLRFSRGLAKKVLVADVVGHSADQIFDAPVTSIARSLAWVGLVSYTAQIYFDFSGYSDMAIGLARMFGFRFPENFHQPYLASGFNDFWRRWHTSFGSWMRDYLYFPLGGNRTTVLKQYRNLWVVFLFSGFWHGAQWTFILWGAYHGLFMTIERLIPERWSAKVPYAGKVLGTLFLVMMSRVLFRAKDVPHAIDYTMQLFSPDLSDKALLWGFATSPYELTMVVVAYLTCLYPLLPGYRIVQAVIESNVSAKVREVIRATTYVVLFVLSITALAGRDFSPFIYFQF